MSTESLLRDERRLGAVAAVSLAAMAVAVVFGTPGHSFFLLPCPLHTLTGFFCPGCGSTRALWYLVHGHPPGALRENALAILLLPFVFYDLGAILTTRWATISSRLRPWSLWMLLVAIVTFSVLRNLHISPFTLLAPTDIR